MVNRFFRLGLPILFAHIVFFAIYITIGFHNSETSFLFESKWYQQSFYNTEFSIKDVLLSPIDVLILGKSAMNAPYWVLRMMFVSSVLIYLIRFVFSKIKLLQNDVIEYLFLIFIILLSCNFYPIISAHLIGMLGTCYQKHDFRKSSWYAFGLIIISMAMIILPRNIKAAFAFTLLILLTPKIKVLNSAFCGKICQFLGDISWGMYSFHWPLMCSVGALWLVNKAAQIGLHETYYIGFFIVFALTFFIAWGFHNTFEKLAAFLTQKLYAVLIGGEKN